MRVLVFGGTDFIGRWAVPDLGAARVDPARWATAKLQVGFCDLDPRDPIDLEPLARLWRYCNRGRPTPSSVGHDENALQLCPDRSEAVCQRIRGQRMLLALVQLN